MPERDELQIATKVTTTWSWWPRGWRNWAGDISLNMIGCSQNKTGGKTHKNAMFNSTCVHKKVGKSSSKWKASKNTELRFSLLSWDRPHLVKILPCRYNVLRLDMWEISYSFNSMFFQLDLDLDWFLFIENDSKSKHRCSAKGVNSESLLSKNFPCHEEPALLHLCGSNDHSQVVWQKIKLQVRAGYLSFVALHCDSMLKKIQIS